MNIKEYFEGHRGVGILSSADTDGMVTSAVYSAPHVFDDGTMAFIMRQRLTYRNLQSNPFACYLFLEEGAGYRGIRLYLKKIKEDADAAIIAKMTRRHLTPEEDKAKGPKYLVHFRVDKILPLVGAGESGVSLK